MRERMTFNHAIVLYCKKKKKLNQNEALSIIVFIHHNKTNASLLSSSTV